MGGEHSWLAPVRHALQLPFLYTVRGMEAPRFPLPILILHNAADATSHYLSSVQLVVLCLYGSGGFSHWHQPECFSGKVKGSEDEFRNSRMAARSRVLSGIVSATRRKPSLVVAEKNTFRPRQYNLQPGSRVTMGRNWCGWGEGVSNDLYTVLWIA